MDLYRYDVYTMVNNGGMRNVRLQDIVDINDPEVCELIATKVNEKKKIPATSINLLSTYVQVQFTRMCRQMICSDFYLIAESRDAANEQALQTSFLYNCQHIFIPGTRMVKCVRCMKTQDERSPHAYGVRYIKACLTDDHHVWLNSTYGTAAKDKDEHMSYYVNQMIQCGVVIIDSSVNKEEYEIQDALGQLPALLKTMPLKINEAMVAFVGLSTNDIHESVQKSIDAYHRTHNITCPSLTK